MRQSKFFRECPLCNCKEKSVIYQMKNTMSEAIRQNTGYPSKYTIVACDRCGMVYTDIDIGEKNIDDYYTQENVYDNKSDLNRYVYKKTREMCYVHIERYIKCDSIIVDVGCGNGSFLNFVQDKGYNNLYGIDPSVKSVEVLRKTGISGCVGSVYQCDKSSIPKADMVISMGVLEHLLFPEKALQKMSELMNDDGYMYVCVPATERYWMTDFPEANFFNHEHINHFTEKTLAALAESVGLQVVESSVDRPCDEIEFAINAVLKKRDNTESDKDGFRYDATGKEAVASYFENRKKEVHKLDWIIGEILNMGTSIIIWGTGNYAGSILNRYPELIDDVLFFVDNNTNRDGTEFHNKKVYSPKMLLERREPEVMDATIVVCVMQAKKEIMEDIKGLKIKNKVIFL